MSKERQRIIKSTEGVIEKLEKGGPGSGRKRRLGGGFKLTGPATAKRKLESVKKGEEIAKKLVPNPCPEKERAYLSVKKAIILLEKYNDLVKSYKTLDNIPKDILKAVDKRPPENWWNSCISRAEKFADDPEAYCGRLWYGPGYTPETKSVDLEKAGKPWSKEQYARMKESFGAPYKKRLGEKVLKCIEKSELGEPERRKGIPLTDEERRERHQERVGTTDLPPRGTGLEKSTEGIDPEELGQAVLDAIEELLEEGEETFTKAVAEPAKTPLIEKPRTPRDFGGQSEIVNPTLANPDKLQPSDKNISG